MGEEVWIHGLRVPIVFVEEKATGTTISTVGQHVRAAGVTWVGRGRLARVP